MPGRFASAFALWCALSGAASLHPSSGEIAAPILGKEFYAGLQETQPIKRDYFLDARLNRIISGKGSVVAVETVSRYKRKYRLTLAGQGSGPVSITYLVFTDRDEYLKMLHKNDIFEFKGQFIIYTPLNSLRDSYIFDVVLEDGAIVVE
ncbi:MAG: hypothetical protein EPN93_07010 [Spirochaetes bacterium]|nr:MAG: hypothetical protein EPN93_07010 [Spirochaetota bacterium]